MGLPSCLGTVLLPVAIAWWLMVGLAVPVGVSYGLYYLVSLPMRRQERARLFLDLLERELLRGRSAEHAVVAIAESRDRSIGIRFYLLAAHVENGLRLTEALRKTPALLSPAIAAILSVGDQIGEIRKVLPACRKSLADGASQIWSGMNYLVILLLCFLPASAVILQVLNIFVFPKFNAIAADFGAPTQSSSLVLRFAPWLSALLGGAYLLILAAAISYVSGPRLWNRLEAGLFPFSALFRRLFPWRQKRMLRDFSATLAVLLDAGVPEETAVSHAADATANGRYLRRAREVIAELRAGVKLTEALRHMDDSGEFRWRVRQAAHSGASFLQTLTGWHESLDARAFEQEQAAAQLITTSLVLVNGLAVGAVGVAVFGAITAIVQEAGLW